MIKIPKKHKFCKRELAMGEKMEMEHTMSKKRARKLAMQHLFEYPHYYSNLKKMEKTMKRRSK